MKVHEIVRGRLYVRGASDHLPASQKLAVLRGLGIEHVVNLWSRPDPDLRAALGDRYVHTPIPDGHLSIDMLLDLESLTDRLCATGEPILVQCHAGRNRSGFLAALMVARMSGKSRRDALRFVRERRPRAVATEAFVRYLEQ